MRKKRLSNFRPKKEGQSSHMTWVKLTHNIVMCQVLNDAEIIVQFIVAPTKKKNVRNVLPCYRSSEPFVAPLFVPTYPNQYTFIMCTYHEDALCRFISVVFYLVFILEWVWCWDECISLVRAALVSTYVYADVSKVNRRHRLGKIDF